MLTKNVIQTKMRNKKGSQGFSLLEVLIAMFVLSIGLLGLAALQTTSYKLNHQSYQRTQATTLLYDMVDRIRANATGSYTQTLTAGPITVTTNCSATTCTAKDMAKYDSSQWINGITTNLAGGQGAVATSGALNRFVVTISWVENGVTKSQKLETEI